MTPKEKAEELIKSYRAINFTTGNYSKMIAFYEDCKQCALIAVDEILNLCWNGNLDAKMYWEEVKKEIENL